MSQEGTSRNRKRSKPRANVARNIKKIKSLVFQNLKPMYSGDVHDVDLLTSSQTVDNCRVSNTNGLTADKEDTDMYSLPDYGDDYQEDMSFTSNFDNSGDFDGIPDFPDGEEEYNQEPDPPINEEPSVNFFVENDEDIANDSGSSDEEEAETTHSTENNVDSAATAEVDPSTLFHKVYIPENPYTKIQKYSLLYQELCSNCNLSRESARAMRHLFNDMHADKDLPRGSKLMGKEACDKLVEKTIPIPLTRSFKVCRNACYLFDDNNAAEPPPAICPECKKDRSVTKTIKMVSIKQKVIELLSSPDIRETLLERQRNTDFENVDSSTYGDIYDSQIFKYVYNKFVKDTNNDTLNLFLKIDIDGFSSSSSRFLRDSTFQIALLPGKAKLNYESYLNPIINELNSLSRSPIIVQVVDDAAPITARVLCLFVNGDGPEINKLLNFAGHTHFYGCRFCTTKGEHKEDGSKNNTGMYFPIRGDETLDRTKESLLISLTDEQKKTIESYGIRKPAMFGKLDTWQGVYSHGFDELHAMSNCAKLMFDFLAPRYSSNFKYLGNESRYPFELSNAHFSAIKLGMERSRRFIPSSAFQSSFKATDPSNVKGFYRSADWISWFFYVVPTLVAPMFTDLNTRKAILAFTRACALSVQWEVSKDNIEEIKRLFQIWFNFLDRCREEKLLSNCCYPSAMHHLHHIPKIIQQCSSLRNISVRSLEREIGNYKRKMKARINADANATNVLQQTTNFKFLEHTKMMDFSVLYNRNPSYHTRGYDVHPASVPEKNKDYPQIWEPFGTIVSLADVSRQSCIEGVITIPKFVEALKGYKHRFLGVGRNNHLGINLEAPLKPAAKLFFEGHLITSSMLKSRRLETENTRGGEYLMFESNVRKRARGEIRTIANWFVGKVLFYFEYDLKLDPVNRPYGSFYCIVEVMKLQKTAQHSKTIPIVQPSKPNENKKYAVLDVADIISIVGLVEKIDLDTHKKPKPTNWYYVISPSTAFDEDMSLNIGKISDLL